MNTCRSCKGWYEKYWNAEECRQEVSVGGKCPQGALDCPRWEEAPKPIEFEGGGRGKGGCRV